jgi:hypothetical protein
VNRAGLRDQKFFIKLQFPDRHSLRMLQIFDLLLQTHRRKTVIINNRTGRQIQINGKCFTNFV